MQAKLRIIVFNGAKMFPDFNTGIEIDFARLAGEWNWSQSLSVVNFLILSKVSSLINYSRSLNNA